ncbi:alpha/beta-Hydrolases superfamily protein [Striga hermonthica]|uniref:Alpha/beta-Hydrolases superfamily protein n=1 Tax=Striga hermonthica TaxID=68872 RepID=A0A9N7MHC8_STRHE|nr:alpha/beta-Hydrolases superfamily protein [Striga hermonthica]
MPNINSFGLSALLTVDHKAVVVVGCAGVCMEEDIMEEGLFPVESMDEAVKILLARTSKKLRELTSTPPSLGRTDHIHLPRRRCSQNLPPTGSSPTSATTPPPVADVIVSTVTRFNGELIVSTVDTLQWRAALLLAVQTQIQPLTAGHSLLSSSSAAVRLK